MRPNSMGRRECFYCRNAIGTPHAERCVLINRKVKVKAVIEVEYDIEVPADWDQSLIEFARNEGSWCASNLISDLETLDKQGCLCPYVQYELIGDEGEPYLKER